jgi:hypothetical protein
MLMSAYSHIKNGQSPVWDDAPNSICRPLHLTTEIFHQGGKYEAGETY